MQRPIHPYRRWVNVLLLLLATLAMMMVMARNGAPLITAATPWGILHLELAFDRQGTIAILDNWKKNSFAIDLIQTAKINTWLDGIFLICYSLFFYLACRLCIPAGYAAATNATAHNFSKLALLTGLLDVLENTGMLLSLYRHGNSLVTIVTAIAASAKWLLVLSLIVYLLVKIVTAVYYWIKTAIAPDTLK